MNLFEFKIQNLIFKINIIVRNFKSKKINITLEQAEKLIAKPELV